VSDAFATFALRRKLARIAGEIVDVERTWVRLRRTLDAVDSVLNLLEPTTGQELMPLVRSFRRGLYFRPVREKHKPANRDVLTREIVSA